MTRSIERARARHETPRGRRPFENADVGFGGWRAAQERPVVRSRGCPGPSPGLAQLGRARSSRCFAPKR